MRAVAVRLLPPDARRPPPEPRRRAPLPNRPPPRADVINTAEGLGNVASCSWDGTIRLYRADGSGKLAAGTVTTITGTPRLHRIDFLPKKPLNPFAVAFSNGDGNRPRVVEVWRSGASAASGRLEGHGAPILGLDALPDGRLVTAGEDRTARVWGSASMNRI